MKKILLLLTIGGALFISSCTKQYNEVTPNKTIVSDPISASNWTAVNGGKEYQVDIDVSKYFGNGDAAYNGVLVYLTFDNGQTFEALPETYNDTAYSYTYSDGVITLYEQSSDNTQVVVPPATFKAKIVLVASN